MIGLNEQYQSAAPAPLFSPGDLVLHRRYGYRAVVVDFDKTCQASTQWYQKNQTQPERNQPWYHLLVHDGTHTTYAAQSNLEADFSATPIEHPLVDAFFDKFEDGRYVRNDTPWPLE